MEIKIFVDRHVDDLYALSVLFPTGLQLDAPTPDATYRREGIARGSAMARLRPDAAGQGQKPAESAFPRAGAPVRAAATDASVTRCQERRR